MDTFEIDTIPVHLTTFERFENYVTALSSTDLLEFHVSNRAFFLGSVVTRMGREVGLENTLVVTSANLKSHSLGARWVFLARDRALIRQLYRTLTKCQLLKRKR